MAANNYFGYTTGTPQFGTTSATSYPTSQTTNYAVQQHAAQQYAAAAPRTNQTTYDTYQNTGHATYQYTARQQPGYDKTQTQTYYTQAAQVAYSTPETPHYQTGVNKTTYTANATGYGTARPAATQKNQAAAAQQTAANSYVYSTNSAAGATGNYTSSYNTAASTSYPATMYVQQPAVVSQQSSGAVGGGASAMQQAMNTAANVQKSQGAGWGFKKGFFKTQKPKPPPKPQQLHYCDVCKISCAGPQTYKEHLEGQKHKKKEASMKITQAQNSRGGTSLRCELCDVTCTGFDAYAAHIRGAKHQKVVKLHTKLGKPIPSTEPVVLSTSTSPPTTAVKGPAGGKANPKPGPAGGSMEGKKVLGTPKINFVGGTKLNTTASPDDSEDLKDDDGKLDGSLEDRNDVQPVGQDYIEEIRNDEGKVISFQCKLCECRFNDPNAKEMHMKGRRHRLQYKKKVNPDLIVDIKPSLRQRKIQEERLRRQQLREDLWKRREEERWREEMRYVGMMEEEERMYWEERRRYEEEMEYYEWYRRYGRDPRMLPPPPPPRGFMGGPSGPNPMMPPRRPDSVDDRHIMAKHTQIYPKEEELSAVQKIVTNTEKALKLVSDFLAESDKPKEEKPKEEKMEEDKKPEVAADGTVKEGSEKEPQQPARILKGVMRVGVLAKGLLLTGDVSVQLVVMCAEKPTRTLLDRVADNLPKQFASVSPDEKYEVKRCVEEAALKVECAAEPTIVVVVTLTSPVMRESAEKDNDPAAPATGVVAAPAGGETVKDPPDVLDRQKCLDALAALRHAKWFQARASGLQSCVMIIRIMRDLCQRVPTWGRLSNWAVELLVEKVICSAGQYLSPGDAVRRVFEAVAGGLLLPGGPGLLDPCEKDALDAAVALTNQEREDITASSQHALRLIAFRQIHKVLGMDALPPPKFTRGQFNRKRRRDNSTGEGNDSEGAEGKKDKKEDSEAMETPEAAEKKV